RGRLRHAGAGLHPEPPGPVAGFPRTGYRPSGKAASPVSRPSTSAGLPGTGKPGTSLAADGLGYGTHDGAHGAARRATGTVPDPESAGVPQYRWQPLPDPGRF